jgi:hypothetical protein
MTTGVTAELMTCSRPATVLESIVSMIGAYSAAEASIPAIETVSVIRKGCNR